MALFGIGKKDNKKVKKEDDVLNMVKEPQVSSDKPAPQKENTGRAHRVLLHHHLSEKTNEFSRTGTYVFRVAKDTNKIEVKKAIEQIYDVHVRKVNMINVLGKSRRQGRKAGYTQDWKKAIVTLKPGEQISGLAEGV